MVISHEQVMASRKVLDDDTAPIIFIRDLSYLKLDANKKKGSVKYHTNESR